MHLLYVTLTLVRVKLCIRQSDTQEGSFSAQFLGKRYLQPAGARRTITLILLRSILKSWTSGTSGLNFLPLFVVNAIVFFLHACKGHSSADTR